MEACFGFYLNKICCSAVCTPQNDFMLCFYSPEQFSVFFQTMKVKLGVIKEI